ncbi:MULTISPECIES: hypothetical protein [Burkholderia cepacia complex]|uniref:hypothetical protein n=1 Tax=Burkholderia cepacia complex TaxID=87882 RepID=UPI00210EFB6C|nr:MULTISPECIES: hypothetical protein [Burkholderia cepacia complex]MCQ4564161.1 hypothetical protein [Burkholderia contaminans]MCW3504562.1 hypothetical protein [Burkholderia cenocepacia]MCW3512024.1 hypothetical protein [Burkholderia cenocepacia]MCW3519643.1 hypothetical protein [Burkholderia cenocepacia]MCW3535001.1 hypothetical protein [Burkholderia cenocepacia]
MTATLYQLTATAAQMCLPVPAAAPAGWLDLLDHWQTLIGATTGGLLGVAGAWIVAVSARSRERRIAASMVLPDLMQVAAAGQSLETALDGIPKVAVFDEEQQADARASAGVRKLDVRRSRLFALHTPAIGQVSDIDARLYAHLFQCRMVHQAFEDGMDVRRDSLAAHMAMSFDPRDRSAIPPEAPPDRQLYADWRLCVEHATLANYFLDRLVFSRWPRWCQRVRMKFSPNDLDTRSEALLKPGPSPAAAAGTFT